MMKLSVMKAVSATCDAQWRSPLAEEILAAWEHDPGSSRGIVFSSNFIFSFTRGGQGQILRFVREDERTREAILAEMRMVAEGVKTTESAWHLARRLGVEMPITEQVYRVLYEDKPAREAVVELMTRDLKAEGV